jgi:hypothetical protein
MIITEGCGGPAQKQTKGSMTAIGAAIGTVALPGIGTAVGAGVGLAAEKDTNRRRAASRSAQIMDEVQKQRDLQLKLSAQSQYHWGIIKPLTKDFAPEIEKGRIAIFTSGAGLNFYLNETFFFTQGKTLSDDGMVLFHKIYEKISSIPQMLFVIEDSNDNGKNDSEQIIWSAASFLYQKIVSHPHQILVKINHKLLDISREPTTFPAGVYPVRIILITPST